MRRVLSVGFVLLASLAAATTARAQTGAAQRVPPLVISSVAGPDLFAFYCASCHGRDGRGHGTVAAALKVPPTDLTALASRHGGVFPRERVEAYVANDRDVPLTVAHGASDMPVWGPVFRGLDPSDALARVRIANLVTFIESIQRPQQP